MNFRWFRPDEIGVHPDAPQNGDLVWFYDDQSRTVMPVPEELSIQQYDNRRWVGFGDYISVCPGDMVCRVLRPEAPTRQPLGTPLSELSGRPGHPGYEKFCAIARSWGHE